MAFKFTQVLMCRPSHYKINYCINPWMNGSVVNRAKAFRQWQNLVKTFTNIGIKVNVIDQEPNLADMVFATDCGIVLENAFLASNFTYRQRQPESNLYLNWFLKNHYKIINLPKDLSFEGGDCLFFNNQLLLGTGFRSEKHCAPFIHKSLNLEVITLDLIEDLFYHLDTCLFIVDDYTAFYYPKAFSKSSRNILKRLVKNLIELPQIEAKNFITNSLIYKNNLIIQDISPTLMDFAKNHFYTLIHVDVSEFNKAGGGIHCLTNIFHEPKSI
jgi:N-dimethylarginine dimethylaminohydrolase